MLLLGPDQPHWVRLAQGGLISQDIKGAKSIRHRSKFAKSYMLKKDGNGVYHPLATMTTIQSIRVSLPVVTSIPSVFVFSG